MNISSKSLPKLTNNTFRILSVGLLIFYVINNLKNNIYEVLFIDERLLIDDIYNIWLIEDIYNRFSNISNQSLKNILIIFIEFAYGGDLRYGRLWSNFFTIIAGPAIFISDTVVIILSRILNSLLFFFGAYFLSRNLVDKKYCISCSSGTDALLIPLMAYGIGPGDAVITTPFTYIATAEVIAILGATPIFIDIYEKTFNIDPDGIEEAVIFAKKQNLVPRAVIPVDLFGLPARYRLIDEVAKKYNLAVIEDFAQAFGSSIGVKKAGSFGNVSATSFYPAKPLGCYGDGGAIFTDDDDLAEKMKSIRVHGAGDNKYSNIRVGLNGRLDTIQAAILLEKFKIFENELKSRNKIASYYKNNINSNSVVPPFIPKNYTSSWAQFSVIAKNKNERKLIINRLSEQKIPAAIFYDIPLHLQKVFKNLNYKKNSLPISEKISNKIFSIPMHPYLNKDNQDKIIEVLNSQ